MKKVYLASPWVNREATKAARGDLTTLGIEVTSRWLDVPDGPSVPDFDRGTVEAAMDLNDIDRADAIIVLTDPRPIGAGHHVELGYAITRSKEIIVVGPVKSIFHYLASQTYPDWATAMASFDTQAKAAGP